MSLVNLALLAFFFTFLRKTINKAIENHKPKQSKISLPSQQDQQIVSKYNTIRANPEIFNLKTALASFLGIVMIILIYFIVSKRDHSKEFTPFEFYLLTQFEHFVCGVIVPFYYYFSDKKIRQFINNIYKDFILDVLNK